MEYTKPQIIKRKLGELRLAIYDYEEELGQWQTRAGQYVGEGAYADIEPEWSPVSIGYAWTPAFHLARWFRRRVVIPAALDGKKAYLLLNTGGEGLVRVNGRIAG
ncbi:MAG: hypothetical protein LBJ10_12390, partial [Clostridiales bacterium]|nr:hypothetical protein [Clostridiales bacterium]